MKTRLEDLRSNELRRYGLDGRVEIAGNEHRHRALRDALVDPSPREIGFDVAQTRVLAKSIDVEDIEPSIPLPRCFQMQIRGPDITGGSQSDTEQHHPNRRSPAALLRRASSAVRSITLESRIGYRLRKQSPFAV